MDARARTDRIDGLHVLDDVLLGHQASHDLDRLQMLIDVTELGVSGYQCADWLREHRHLDLGMSDHRRVLATLSIADDATTVDRLIQALTDFTRHAPTLPASTPIHVPAPNELALETACAPHRAFFGPTVQVPADSAAGWVAAEQLTPYPPGIPVVVPGERLDAAVIDYLRSGLAGGMAVPDATDPSLDTFRVCQR
jgi:lysine decarboxylase